MWFNIKVEGKFMIFIDHISHKCDINKTGKCTLHDNYWNSHAPELSAKKAHSYQLNAHTYLWYFNFSAKETQSLIIIVAFKTKLVSLIHTFSSRNWLTPQTLWHSMNIQTVLSPTRSTKKCGHDRWWLYLMVYISLTLFFDETSTVSW